MRLFPLAAIATLMFLNGCTHLQNDASTIQNNPEEYSKTCAGELKKEFG